jgi:hypothetical protein
MTTNIVLFYLCQGAHDKLKTRLKETIHKAFSHRNYGSKFVVLGYNSIQNCRYDVKFVGFLVSEENFREKWNISGDEARSPTHR